MLRRFRHRRAVYLLLTKEYYGIRIIGIDGIERVIVIRKGISIWSFRGGNFESCFRLAKSAGFDGVEIDLSENGELSLSSSDDDILMIAESAKQCGIELYSVATGLYWSYSFTDEHTKKKAREIAVKQLRAAHLLGCDTILVLPGQVSETCDYDDAYETALGEIKALVPYAEEYGVSIGIENVWNKFLLSPLEMRSFIDEINSPFVGAYLDVGNVAYTGYPEQWVKILGRRIKKVHFKDYKRSVGSVDGFVDLLEGDVDFPAVISALEKTGYDGWLTAEMIPPYHHYPEATLYNASFAMDRMLGKGGSII